LGLNKAPTTVGDTQTQEKIMSNMTPFEIRLELLKMAKDMLHEEYYAQRERISNNWSMQCETARHKGETPPEHPGFPPIPSETDIIAKAQALNGFVSNVVSSEPPKVTKKSS
jgi:hypothetical protein